VVWPRPICFLIRPCWCVSYMSRLCGYITLREDVWSSDISSRGADLSLACFWKSRHPYYTTQALSSTCRARYTTFTTLVPILRTLNKPGLDATSLFIY
jgi:hypothetical protein